MNSPASYFIHCDSMAKTEILHNGKLFTLLAKFSMRGNAYERVDYAALTHNVCCVTLTAGTNIYIVCQFL